MAVTLNGHSYTAADFLGYGHAATDPQTGLPRFPDGIFSDMIAHLASASTILTGALAPGAAGAIPYSNGSAWVRSATPTLTTLTLSGNLITSGNVASADNAGTTFLCGGNAAGTTSGGFVGGYGNMAGSFRGAIRIIAGVPDTPTGVDGCLLFYTGGSTIRWSILRDGTLSATGAMPITTTGIISGVGSGLTALNASNLSSGTVASARVSGSYTGLTGVGALTTGSIASGFGAINIGSNAITGGVVTGSLLKGGGSAPTPSVQSGNMTIDSIDGTDTAGRVFVHFPTSSTESIIRITFTAAKAAAPFVVVGAYSINSVFQRTPAAVVPYGSSTTYIEFFVPASGGGALGTIVVDYHVIG